MAKDGSTAPTAIDDIDAADLSIVQDDTDLFVAMGVVVNQATGRGSEFRRTAYGRVMAAPKGGAGRTLIFEGFRGVRGLAIDATNAYWLSGSSDAAGNVVLDGVMRAPKTGGNATFVATSQRGAADLAADASGVYWSVDKRVVRLSGPAQRPVTVVDGISPTAVDLALDDTAVYLRAGDELRRVAKAGGAPVTIATHVKRYALDAWRVYYATDAGVFARAKDGGGDPSSILAGPASAITVDGASVYGASGDAIVRIAK